MNPSFIKPSRRLLFVSSVLLLTACSSSKSEQSDTEQGWPESIERWVAEEVEKERFSGGLVISSNGDTKVEFYGGLANRSFGIPVNKNTRFDIASVNKSIIAALTLRAVERGLLEWYQPITDQLTSYGYSNNFDSKITLHHLLSHTSGLPDYDGVDSTLVKDNYTALKRMHVSRSSYIEFIDSLTPIGAPEEQFHYSNFGYHLAAMLLEAAYDQPFKQIVTQQFSLPLGLKSVLCSMDNKEVIPELATGYQWQEHSERWEKNPFIDLTVGRRIFCTVSDLNRWAAVMDNPGYLSNESISQMTSNQLSNLKSSVSYGYGWVTVNEKNPSEMGKLPLNVPYLIHGGSTDGYKAMLININHGEFIISFMSNVGDRTDEMQFARTLVKLMPIE